MVSVEQQDPGRTTQVSELACDVGAGGCLQTECAPCRGFRPLAGVPSLGQRATAVSGSPRLRLQGALFANGASG